MKQLLILIVAFLVANAVLSQTQVQFKYQAVLRDASGNIISNQSKAVVINILQGSINGTSVFTEIHNVTTTSQGIINLNIGSVNTIDLALIDWSTGSYFIKITVGGIEMGTSQLLAVPYALYAKKAETVDYNKLTGKPNLFSGSYIDLTNKPALFSGSFQDLLNKPTTISGFGITDAVTITGNQSIAGIKTFTGTITGKVNANDNIVSNVSAPVNSTDAANKAYVDALKQQIKVLEDNLIAAGTYKLIDVDGNQYNVVKIGTQVWMKENLVTLKFNDGTLISNVTDNTAWQGLSTPAYCWFNNDISNKAIYGALYNWYATDVTSNGGKNICPVGWHAPTDAEFTTLTDYLGGLSVAGGKMKEIGTTHWTTPNTSADNSSGFTALPGGYRNVNGVFSGFANAGYWWCTLQRDASNAWYYDVIYNGSNAARNALGKTNGFSIRCLRD